MLTRARAERWNAEAITRILSALTPVRWVWDEAIASGAEVEKLYWERTSAFIEGDISDVVFAIEKLIVAGRALHALPLAGYRVKLDLPADLLTQLLLKALDQPWDKLNNSNEHVMFQHCVEEIVINLDGRDEVSEDDMAQLEWAYLPLLQHCRQPKVLQTLLARDPGFFITVLSALYTPDSGSGVEDPEPPDGEHAAAVASQADKLLESWSIVPGTKDGAIEAEALKHWIKEARALAVKTGRLGAADGAIGNLFAKAANDNDGYWPPISIREAIDSTRSRELERGIITGVYNNRDVTTRGPTDGGAQERDLANFYRTCSQATAPKWPRTSAVLERIAKEFDRMAEHYDEDAERNQW